jgi:hypothetical protein
MAHDRRLEHQSPRRQPELTAEIITAGRIAVRNVAPGLVQIFADARP